MRAPVIPIVLALAAFAPPALAQGAGRPAAPAAPASDEPSDEALLAAFDALDAATKEEVVEWFTAECERLPTFQQTLIRRAIQQVERDPFAWPDAPPPAAYDPKVHAPAQPIPRRFVDASKGAHAAVVERILRKVPKRDLLVAYEYDWASGEVVRVAERRDPHRVSRNAVRGFEPRIDVVEAIVTRLLDRGTYRSEARAFGHAYADREGNAYRELTLYDAWASGAEMEMPDVECLGVIHDLAEDGGKRWVAPVPPNAQKRLYTLIGEHFVPYQRARGLITALARTYVEPDPVLRDSYGPAVGRLHAFWEREGSDPKALRDRLPDGDGWARWIETEGAAVDKDVALWNASVARRERLREDQARVRRTFAGILRELGAL